MFLYISRVRNDITLRNCQIYYYTRSFGTKLCESLHNYKINVIKSTHKNSHRYEERKKTHLSCERIIISSSSIKKHLYRLNHRLYLEKTPASKKKNTLLKVQRYSTSQSPTPTGHPPYRDKAEARQVHTHTRVE